jgi:hypothetical protein
LDGFYALCVITVDATQSIETIQSQVCAWLQAKEYV